MSYLVALPDGTNAEFPDEVSHDEAADIISKQFFPQAGMLESGAAGLATGIGGLPLGIAHAVTKGAAVAGVPGAEDADAYVQQKRKELEEWGKQHGTDTFVGKTAAIAGGVLPFVAAAPFTGGMSLMARLGMNAATMGVSGAVDAYEAAKADGASDKEAWEKAALAAGMGTVAPEIVGGGSRAVGAALKAGEGALPKMALAAGEGAAFKQADTIGNKAIEVANDRQTAAPWFASLEDSTANALAFGAVRGVSHMMEAPKRAASDKAKADAEAALAAEEEARLAKKAAADEKSALEVGPLPGSVLPQHEGIPGQQDWIRGADDLTIPKPTGLTPDEQERKGYVVEPRAADMEAALRDAEGGADTVTPEQRKLELQGQMQRLEAAIEDSSREMEQIQNPDKSFRATTPEESIAAAARVKQFKTALADMQKEHASISIPATPDEKLARAYSEWQKAKAQGDPDAVDKYANQIVTLKAAGALPPPAVPMTQTAMRMKDFTGTSETTDMFNQRVVGPEMADAREASAAAQQKVAAEQAALQRIAANPAGDANAMRQQKLARERAASLLAQQSAPIGSTPPVQGESVLRSVVSRGVGTTGRPIEDIQRDYALARSNRDRDGIRKYGEEIQDYMANAAARTAGAPRGELTAQLAGVQPPEVAAHQDALISRAQGLNRLLMAKPAEMEAARGNLRARMVTEIETARGTQMTRAERQSLAAQMNPILDRLQAVRRPTMTDAKAAQDAMNALRSKYTVRNVSVPYSELVGPREPRGTELLREQAAGTPNTDLLANASRRTFAPETAPVAAAPSAAKPKSREANLNAELQSISAQLEAHRRAIGESGMTSAEEAALGAGDISKRAVTDPGETAAALARNTAERMDLHGRIEALQKRDHELNEWMLDVEPDAKTRAEKSDVEEVLNQARADLVLLESAQSLLVERTRQGRIRGALPDTADVRSPAELRALHARKQDIHKQLSDIRSEEVAQAQAASVAKRTAAGKAAATEQAVAAEKEAHARELQAARERLAEQPGMSITYEAAVKAQRLIETGPERIERLRAKIADPEATKTTRNRDKHELKELLRVLKMAHDVIAGKEGALGIVEERIVELSDKIAAEQELVDTNNLVGAKRKYRMDKIAELKRERAALRTAQNGTFNPPKKTPIAGTDRTRTLSEQLAAATKAYAVVEANPDARAGDKKSLGDRVEQLQKEVQAADDKRATDFLEKALTLEQMGTTGRLPKGRVSQASRKEVVAGDPRTGSSESIAGENKTGTHNPIEEERRVVEINRTVGKPEQRAANAVADELGVATKPTEKTPLENLDELISIKQRLLAEKIGLKDAAEKRAAELLRKNEENTSITDEQRVELAEEIKARPERIEKDIQRLEVELDKLSTEVAPLRDAAEAAAERAAKAKTEPQASIEDARAAVAETKVKPKAEKRARGKAKEEVESLEEYDTEPDNAFARTEDPFAGEWEAASKPSAERKSTPLSATAEEAARDGRTMDVVKDIKENGSTPEIRALAAQLEPYVLRTKMGVEADLTLRGEKVAGLYDPVPNESKLHDKALTEEDALHELGHAATDRVLLTPKEELTPGQRAARNELEGMHRTIAASDAFKGEHAGKDVREFVAEVMSNKALREKMDSVGKPVTLWKRFVNAVKRLWVGAGGKGDLALDSERAQALIERILMPSRKLSGVATAAPSPLRKDSPLKNSFVDRDTAWDRTKAASKGQYGLAAEQALADHRASLRKILEQYGKPGKYAAWAIDQSDHLVNIIHDSMVKGAYGKIKDDRGEWVLAPGNGPKYEDFSDAVSKANLGSARANMDGFHSYLMGLHAEQVGWHKLNLENAVGLRKEWQDNMRYIDAHPEVKTAFEKANKVLQKMNSAQVDLIENTHSLPPDVIADMRKLTNYVPMYRINGDSLVMLGLDSGPKVIGDIRKQPWLYELAGGTDKLMPLESAILRNTSILTGMAMRNHAMTEVAYHLQGIGKGVGPINPTTGKASSVMVIHRGSADDKSGSDIIRFRQSPDKNVPGDEGERWVQVNTKGTVAEHIPTELVVRALAGIHQINSPILKLASLANGLLRSGVTRMPSYLFSQTLKDALNASFLGSVRADPITSAFKSATQLVKGYADTSPEQHMMEKYGSATSSNVMTDSHDLHKVMLQMAKGTKGSSAWSKAKAALDTTAMAAEGATRAQILQDVKKSGGSDIEAIYKAARSMDFGGKGADPIVRVIGQLVPFFHSQVTGINNFVHAVKGDMPASELLHSKQALYRRGIGLAVGAFAYALMMENDDKWKAMPLRDKLDYFHMPVGKFNGETLKLGIPFQPGVAFYSIPIALTEMWKRKFSREDYKTIAEIFSSEFLPMGGVYLPQLTKGASAVAANYDSSTGQAIESAASQRLTPDQRYGNNTSEITKMVSKRLVDAGVRLSPAQLDYLTNSYFGQLPLAVAKMADGIIAEHVKGVERPTKHLSEGPMGRFFQKAVGTNDIDHVYEIEDRAKEAKGSLDKMLNEGRGTEARAFFKANRLQLALAETAPDFTSTMSTLTQTEQVIRNLPKTKMDADTKQQKIDALRAKKADVALKFYKVLDRMKERFKEAA